MLFIFPTVGNRDGSVITFASFLAAKRSSAYLLSVSLSKRSIGLKVPIPVAAFIVVISHSIVLFLFASQGISNFLQSINLPSIPLVPVSSSQAVVGAIIGIGLLKGGKEVKWSVAGKITIGWFTLPIIAAIISMILLYILSNFFN